MDTELAAKPPTKKAKQENPFWNLTFNIIVPTIILNQSSKLGENGALIALLLALAFPIGYSIHDIIKSGRPNIIAVFGLLNVLFTGGLALFEVEGIWFAVKEAAFPAVIGLVVLGSAFTKNPLIQMMIYRPEIFDVEKISNALIEKNSEAAFHRSLKNATFMLAGSFALSALLNFILASMIFEPIDASIQGAARSDILNEQIAEMTWKGYVVIAAPLLLFMAGIFYYVVNGIKSATGLQIAEVIHDQAQSSKPQ